MVLNMMLLSFILGDPEARAFFVVKFQSWKEQNVFNFQRKFGFKSQNSQHLNNKISPCIGADFKTGKETNRSRGTAKNSVFIIDV